MSTENSTINKGATQQLVKDFWNHMMQRYGTRALIKHGSWAMRAIAQLLSMGGILDARSFMNNYTTVIGKTIYTPFEIGSASVESDLWRQIVTAVHEHQHVVQQNRDGQRKFMFRYLTNSSSRARYEAEAYRCNMEMHFWRFGEVPSAHDLAWRLKDYGCAVSDIDMAEELLEASAVKISQGHITNQATFEAIAWLVKRAPNLAFLTKREETKRT